MHNIYNGDSIDAIWLSVVIPAHDEGNLLQETAASVSQAINGCDGLGTDSVEVILMQDLPSTETAEAAEAIAHHYPNIRLLNNTGSHGPAAARNAALREARGEWVGFLDGDDRWRKGTLNAVVACIQQHPDARWIGGDFAELNGATGEVSTCGELESRPTIYNALRPAFETGAVQRCPKPLGQFLEATMSWTSATFVHKDALVAVGGFDERFRRAEDTHLWYRLARYYDFYFIPAVIAEYRQRETTVQRRGYSPGYGGRMAVGDLLRRKDFRPYRTRLKKRFCRAVLEDCLHFRSNGRWRDAMESLIDGLIIAPANPKLWRQVLAVVLRRA